MAEFVMKDMVKKAGLENQFQIASAATHYDELGSPVYPPARRIMNQHGINCTGHCARLLERSDYDRWDYLIGMDSANLRNMCCFLAMRRCEGRKSRRLVYIRYILYLCAKLDENK